MYTDEEWDNVMAHLNNEAEKAPPEGISKLIETPEEFIGMLRTTEAIKPAIVNSEALKHRREFQELERQKAHVDQAAVDVQDRIDNHPGNPNNP